MPIPEYTAPATLADALHIKKERGADARVIAGGTDLILRMRDKVLSPAVLLDLRRVSLDTISLTGDTMHLGTCVTLSQLLASADIARLFPALSAACREFAGPPIRNRATLGGNIVNASPAADLVPPLMAYDANIVLTSSAGERVMPLVEFFTGPGQTVLQADEILTGIRLALMPPRTAATFIKLGQRRSMAISMVNGAARLTPDAQGMISVARIVLGAVAPTPIRAVAAEGMLTGKPLSEETIDQAAGQATKEIAPISDLRATQAYREKMTAVLGKRVLTAAGDELARNVSDD